MGRELWIDSGWVCGKLGLFCAFVWRTFGFFAKLHYGQACLSVQPAVVFGVLGDPPGLFIGSAGGVAAPGSLDWSG